MKVNFGAPLYIECDAICHLKVTKDNFHLIVCPGCVFTNNIRIVVRLYKIFCILNHRE